ncbi:hypothetical protein ACFXKD_18745 [Nocardiopsis aegyptia]|uniref:hypothetical protein n=1 Tax=Nocardiopsis aegyptia TaxID=220378 RepID=UPI00366CE03F
MYVPNALLGRLVGRRLYSVQFVLDRVQLWFDGDASGDTPSLLCDVPPRVDVDGRCLGPTDPGWRDALCGLIGQDVVATHEATGSGLRLDFALGAIRLHPTQEEVEGPEIAHLSGFDDRSWMVWRPGEDTFEDL